MIKILVALGIIGLFGFGYFFYPTVMEKISMTEEEVVVEESNEETVVVPGAEDEETVFDEALAGSLAGSWRGVDDTSFVLTLSAEGMVTDTFVQVEDDGEEITISSTGSWGKVREDAPIFSSLSVTNATPVIKISYPQIDVEGEGLSLPQENLYFSVALDGTTTLTLTNLNDGTVFAFTRI